MKLTDKQLDMHAVAVGFLDIEADMDGEDLQCDDELSAEEAEYVREFIRTTIVNRLMRGDFVNW